jgi:hypothetical protein
MNCQNIDQYVVGIFADYKGVGITLIGCNETRDTFWVFDHIFHRRATIQGIRDSLDSLFLRFPEIRKIHVNCIEHLKQELSTAYLEKLFVGEGLKSKVSSTRSELRSEIKVIEFEIDELAFILNSYINDGKLIFNDSLLVQKNNLKTEIENFQLNDINQSVFSLYIAITEIEPLKYSKLFYTSAFVGH